MIFNIIYNIFLFTVANIIVLLLISWISWNYYVEYKKNEIEYLIDTIITLSKTPELFDKYKEDIQGIINSFNNILTPSTGINLNDLKREFKSRANFESELNAIKASATAAAGAEATRIGAEVKADALELVQPVIDGWNNFTSGWNNFWSGKWHLL
jgi:hypothetical protein